MMKRYVRIEFLLAFAICLVTAGIIGYKMVVLEYTMTTIQPEDGYFVRLAMEVNGNGRNCHVDVTLPVQTERQRIKQEKQVSSGFRYSISRGRIGRWYAPGLDGDRAITYTCFAQTEARKYPLPEGEPIPTEFPAKYEKYLKSTRKIQSDAEEIQAKAFELMGEGVDVKTALQNVYNYVYRDVEYKKVRGPTRALTALRLGEASCNGKVRLMVALLRAREVPARMAKGVILESNRKRTTHAWAEALVGDTWVPFCPTNGYFAEIPEKYLELVKGDQAAFTHSKNIGFDWKWVIQHQLNHREKAVLSNANNSLNILNDWVSLKDYQISLELIMIILLVPIGATVVSFTRNIIGLVPFGTFMPALIAVSFRDTGFMMGSIFFLVVILVGALVNAGLLRLRLLHIPRLVIILTVVVMSIMAVSILCIRLGITAGAAVSLFPMAILSLTCERFTQSILEDSWTEAFRRMIVTYIVSCACYAIISLEFLQTFIVAFPELLLANIAINLIIGSWTGMRLLEYHRFRGLLGRPLET